MREDTVASVVSLEDQMAIRELLAAYNWAIDGNDPDAWVATFTDGGTFDGIHGQFTGHDALTQFIHDYWQSEELSRTRGAQHWIDNVVIEGTEGGEEARSRCYGTVLLHGDLHNVVSGTWYYEDDLVKQHGAWRFQRRYVRQFPIPPGAEQ